MSTSLLHPHWSDTKLQAVRSIVATTVTTEMVTIRVVPKGGWYLVGVVESGCVIFGHPGCDLELGWGCNEDGKYWVYLNEGSGQNFTRHFFERELSFGEARQHAQHLVNEYPKRD